MALFDILIPSRRRRRKLFAAVESGSFLDMTDVLPMVERTNPTDPRDLNCLLAFFERFAEYATEAPKEVLDGLAHLTSGKPLSAAQLQDLTRIFLSLTMNALNLNRTKQAVTFGLAGFSCAALDKSQQHEVLGALAEAGCDHPRVIDTLRTTLSNNPDDTLILSVQKGSTCDIDTLQMRAAAAASLAQIIIDTAPDCAWAYQHAGLALLITGKSKKAARLLEQGFSFLLWRSLI